jgi:hypothetical protein
VSSTVAYKLLKIPTIPGRRSCVEPELGTVACPTGTTKSVVNEKSAILFIY